MDLAAERLPLDGRDGTVAARPLPLRRPALQAAAGFALLACLGGAAPAQTVGPPAKHNNNTYGSPLDTLKSSRLWTDTPVPKDFVRESRPPAAALDYAPLTGSDPERAKPRDAANVAALQAELERAGARLGGTTGRPRRSAAASAVAAVKPAAKLKTAKAKTAQTRSAETRAAETNAVVGASAAPASE